MPDSKQHPTMPRARVATAAVAFALVAGSACLPHSAAAQELDSAMENSERAVADTKHAQKTIDKLDQQTQKLLNEYRASLKQLGQLHRYNDSQRRQIKAQQKELASLDQNINSISSLQRSVQPLMDDMYQGLRKLVKADMPFLPQERHSRLKRLKGTLNDPDKTPAQRYRLLINAYQVEAEYGRTIGTYRGDVTADGNHYQNVQFLRIGRLMLIFKTDDDKVLKIYDTDDHRWKNLDRSYLSNVRTAIRLANKQIPPQLLMLPVPAPQKAEQTHG